MKPWISWVLFFVVSAVLFYVLAKGWPSRVFLFLLMSIPVMIWAVRKSR